MLHNPGAQMCPKLKNTSRGNRGSQFGWESQTRGQRNVVLPSQGASSTPWSHSPGRSLAPTGLFGGCISAWPANSYRSSTRNFSRDAPPLRLSPLDTSPLPMATGDPHNGAPQQHRPHDKGKRAKLRTSRGGSCGKIEKVPLAQWESRCSHPIFPQTSSQLHTGQGKEPAQWHSGLAPHRPLGTMVLLAQGEHGTAGLPARPLHACRPTKVLEQPKICL